MPWDTTASAILAAAVAAPLSSPLARAIVAPGPAFARDCRMVAVYVVSTRSLDLGLCATAPLVGYSVTFVADCVPPPGDDGGPPPADEISAWSLSFLADCEAIHAALGDLAASGALGGSCDAAVVGDGTPTGPQGGVAQMTWPVTVTAP